MTASSSDTCPQRDFVGLAVLGLMVVAFVDAQAGSGARAIEYHLGAAGSAEKPCLLRKCDESEME